MLIVKDSERHHSMGSPMDRTPPLSGDLIEVVKSMTYHMMILHFKGSARTVTGCRGAFTA